MPMTRQRQGIRRLGREPKDGWKLDAATGKKLPPDEYDIYWKRGEHEHLIGRTQRVSTGKKDTWRPWPAKLADGADWPEPRATHTLAIEVLCAAWEAAHPDGDPEPAPAQEAVSEQPSAPQAQDERPRAEAADAPGQGAEVAEAPGPVQPDDGRGDPGRAGELPAEPEPVQPPADAGPGDAEVPSAAEVMREAVDEAEAVIAVAETMPEGSTERSEAFGLADELTQVAEEAAAVVLDEGEQPALVVRDGDEVQLLPTEFIRVGTEHASADVPGAVSDDDLAAFLEPAVPVAPLPPQTGPHVLPPTAHAPVPASAHVWDDGQPAPVQAQAPAVPDQPQQLAPITASDEDWLTAPVTAEGKTEKGEDPIGEMFPWS